MTPIPNATRKRILTLDMHEVPPAEIARLLGVNRSTTEQIISRTRGPRQTAHRGKIVLLYDPADIFSSGARFNRHDVDSMIDYSDLADGTLFRIVRRNGSTFRAEVQNGKLVNLGGEQ